MSSKQDAPKKACRPTGTISTEGAGHGSFAYAIETLAQQQAAASLQPGLSLTEFQHSYGTEAQCELAVERARWPDGFVCGCGHAGHGVVWHGRVKTFQCRQCRRQTTLTSGTIFEATKLPLRLWFLAMYWLTQTKNNVAALELRRVLGVCYRTAWRLKHKLLQVMGRSRSGSALGRPGGDRRCLSRR